MTTTDSQQQPTPPRLEPLSKDEREGLRASCDKAIENSVMKTTTSGEYAITFLRLLDQVEALEEEIGYLHKCCAGWRKKHDEANPIKYHPDGGVLVEYKEPNNE